MSSFNQQAVQGQHFLIIASDLHVTCIQFQCDGAAKLKFLCRSCSLCLISQQQIYMQIQIYSLVLLVCCQKKRTALCQSRIYFITTNTQLVDTRALHGKWHNILSPVTFSFHMSQFQVQMSPFLLSHVMHLNKLSSCRQLIPMHKIRNSVYAIVFAILKNGRIV